MCLQFGTELKEWEVFGEDCFGPVFLRTLLVHTLREGKKNFRVQNLDPSPPQTWVEND